MHAPVWNIELATVKWENNAWANEKLQPVTEAK